MEKSKETICFKDTLDFLVSLEKKRISIMEQELSGLPEGRLHLAYQGNKSFFQQEYDGHRHGIMKDTDLVYKLARKRYLQVFLQERRAVSKQRLTNKRETIQSRKRFELENLLERYAKAGLDILRITCSEQAYKWTKASFRHNTMHPEELIYETYSGIKVRSKSEQNIGNRLELRGIPYRYEMEVRLDVGWMEDINRPDGGKYKRYYPDFVIPMMTGELILWEHLGKVHEERYRARNMEKICAYRQCGFCDDAHLILTFERDMVKLENIDQLIATRILPLL